ncbi:PAP2 superfamily-domain-containing protein, partial [Thamnocephalis sphaerospora]
MASAKKEPATVAVAAEPDQRAVGLEGFHDDMLPAWRSALRRWLLVLVDAEQPVLSNCRSPWRDVFFTYTTNLGTHTFFLLTIPLLFWCGYADVGRGLAVVLVMGVFGTGFLKDLLCLPRPYSPPVHRLCFSKSHRLEYGFPSTHSANAVSIGLFLLAQLDHFWPYDATASVAVAASRLAVQTLLWVYMGSITFGRLYCGMHGLVDVVSGTLLGIGVYEVWRLWWPVVESWAFTADPLVPYFIVGVSIALVILHPDPAEPCPCLDDSIAVVGVILGLLLATWHYPQMVPDVTPRGSIPFDYASIGFVRAILRIVLGVVVMLVWRIATKLLCYKLLPPLYRLGHFPYRKFYAPATTYTFPAASEIERVPSIVNMPSAVVDRVGNNKVGYSNPAKDKLRQRIVAPQPERPVRPAQLNCDDKH